MSKYTRGPWTAHKDEVSATEDRLVADCQSDVTISKAESYANARLIAAAPELLAACKLAVKAMQFAARNSCNLDDSPDAEEYRADIRTVQSVIAKAEGR
jgi:hypothetical protein